VCSGKSTHPKNDAYDDSVVVIVVNCFQADENLALSSPSESSSSLISLCLLRTMKESVFCVLRLSVQFISLLFLG